MKLYVTADNDAGRSYIESVEELPEARMREIWSGTLDDDARMIDGLPADGTYGTHVEPPANGLRWLHVRIPPRQEWEAWDNYKPTGFHRTRSVDFDHLVAGRLDCELDEGIIHLEPGDSIIMKAANHSWVNPGDEVAVLLAMLQRPIVHDIATPTEDER